MPAPPITDEEVDYEVDILGGRRDDPVMREMAKRRLSMSAPAESAPAAPSQSPETPPIPTGPQPAPANGGPAIQLLSHAPKRASAETGARRARAAKSSGPGLTVGLPVESIRGEIEQFRAAPRHTADAELADAQERDRKRDAFNDISASMYAAFNRQPVPFGRPKGGEASNLLQRRESEAKRRNAAMQLSELDPSSPGSRQMQQLVRSLHPEVAGQLGPSLDRLPRGKLLQLMPHLQQHSETQRKTQYEAERVAREEETAAAKLEEERRRIAESRGWKTGDDASKRKWDEEQAILDRESRERAAAASAGRAEGRASSTELRDLGARMPPGAGGFYEQLDAIKSIVAKNKGKVPGVGRIQGNSLLPDEFKSDDAIELQKYAKQMMLAYRNLVTGTGGSIEEMNKIDEAGADLKNERSFLKGLEALERGYTARLKMVYAGYSPEVVERYQSAAPGLRPRSGDIQSGATGGPTPVAKRQRPDGSIEVKYSDNSVKTFPAGTTRF
jgi:hypothetical protein